MNKQKTVWFVCLHGSAKSLIAAELAARIGSGSGTQVRVQSAGIEPDPDVPPHVVTGMRGEGVDVSRFKPKLATPSALADATHVVSFGPNLQGIAPQGSQIETWSDVPNVSEGYATARDVIAQRVADLMKRL